MIELLQFLQTNGVADVDVADETHVFVFGDLGERVNDVLHLGMIGRNTVPNETERHRRLLDDVDRDWLRSTECE